MDGVQQCPLVAEGIVATPQLALDGAEGLHHDLLALSNAIAGLLAIVAARSDHPSVGDVGLRVADEYHGEHIHPFGVEVAQRGQRHLLVLAPRLPHIAQGRVRPPTLQKEFLQPVELPVAVVGAGVVDGGHEIGLGSRPYAPLDGRPGRHQVGERDDRQVVTDGSAEQGGRLLEGGDAGEGNNLWRGGTTATHLTGRMGGARQHLVDEGCHAVDAGVAGGDDHDGLARLGQAQGRLGTLALPLHPRIDTFATVRYVWRDELKVILIAHDGICPAHSLDDGGGDVLRTARPEACYDNLTHNAVCLLKEMKRRHYLTTVLLFGTYIIIHVISLYLIFSRSPTTSMRPGL